MSHGTPQKRRQYEAGRARGYRSYRSAAKARAVYLEIKERTEMPDCAIAAAAGMSLGTLNKLKHGVHKQVQFQTYRALRDLLDSNPAPVTRALAVGAQRRIDGLARMGWPLKIIRARLGWRADDVIRPMKPTDTIPLATHEKIAALYDELCMIPGPSKRSRVCAEHAGKAPPLAWDDDTIDDPDARPNIGGGRGGRTPTRYVDEVKVVRRLAGDKSFHLNKLEAAEVRARLIARDIGTGEMEAVYGIRPLYGKEKL